MNKHGWDKIKNRVIEMIEKQQISINAICNGVKFKMKTKRAKKETNFDIVNKY